MARMLFLLLAIGLFNSCSSGSVESKLRKIFGNEKSEDVVKTPVNKVNYGPTINNSKLFRDATKKYGLENVKGVRFYAVDLNLDGSSDLVVLPNYYSKPDFYFFSRKRKKFYKSKYSVTEDSLPSSFLKFIDLNNDGVMDMISGTLNQRSELTKRTIKVYRGRLRKGKYQLREVSSVFTAQDSRILKNLPLASISLIDYDLDGKLDMYFGNWFRYQGQLKTTPTTDFFFAGNRFRFFNNSGVLDKEFSRTDDMSEILTNARPTFATSTCDVDQNGYPDVLTASSSGFSNKLWLNIEHPKRKDRYFKDFANVSDYAADYFGRSQLTGGGNTFSVNCADYNNDGIMDIYVGELFYSYDNEEVDRSSILTGKQKKFPPKFIRTSYTNDYLDNWSQGDRRGVWFDFNNDGLLDLLVDNAGFPPKSRLVLFQQQPDHEFVETSLKAGMDFVNPTGSIVLDLNNDGKLDIISGQSNIRDAGIESRIYVFENRTRRGGKRALRFYLRGRKANRYGQGAMLLLQTNKGIRRQWVDYSQGAQASQNEAVVHFGLNRGEKPISVQVKWPYSNKKKQLVKRYKLSKYKFKRFLNITVCDNGKQKVGVFGSCR